MRQHLFFDHALLPSGWARDVRITVTDGTIDSIAHGATSEAAMHLTGIAVPGVPNLHSHAFQRGMAGLAERRGPNADDFWTWREVMYRFLGELSPDDVESISAFAYMEMLEAGFTTVGEFHYLHHNIDGTPYADLGEMAGRIAAATAKARIGLTLLPSFYAYGGFGGAPVAPSQRRFFNGPERFLKLAERARAITANLPEARIGIAPHSLRAVTPDTLGVVCTGVPNGPIHIHAAEQEREVAQCIAALGRRPVEWLLENIEINSRWCVVHATHMTDSEIRSLAASGAVAGLCPLTEASLGDGTFDGKSYRLAGGRFGIGTDSNIQIDAAAELRQLEYAQRLARRARNVMANAESRSTGRFLFEATLAGGAQALQQPVGALAVGKRADIVLLDENHPDLATRFGDEWLDAWIFVLGRAAVKTVLVGGNVVVEAGHHLSHEEIERQYGDVAWRLSTRLN